MIPMSDLVSCVVIHVWEVGTFLVGVLEVVVALLLNALVSLNSKSSHVLYFLLLYRRGQLQLCLIHQSSGWE